jgi:hypothetical protein
LSHLEFANQFFQPHGDMTRCEHHIRGAQKALIAFRNAEAEYIFSDDGWTQLSALTEPLALALHHSGFEQLGSDLGHISDYVNRVLAQRGIKSEPLVWPIATKKAAALGCIVARSEEILDRAVLCVRQNDSEGINHLFDTGGAMEVCQETSIYIKEHKTAGKVIVTFDGCPDDFWTLSSYLNDP